mgnify:CR=1 FL=1
MDIIIGFILGVVEGLTEFAPVSSTGHMILVGHLLNFQGTVRASTFEVVIQLGSILAVVFIFWERLLSLIGLSQRQFRVQTLGKKNTSQQLSLLHLLIAMFPAVVAGAFFHGTIKEKLFSAETVLIGLIAGGVLMIVAEVFRKPRFQTSSLDQVTYKQALVIGLFQCLALWPGFSRSGSTISGGLLVGINHKTASEFTFILAVPMMLAATVKDLYESWHYLSINDLPLFVTGFVTAFVVALFAIKYFLRLISKLRLTPFALYRFVLAGLFWLFLL